ncbi:cutinase-domain-containing protein [Infundibulicybe gibba]|nr:cutinase-domain-containing protein [Infundibulicybe gibba]
MFSFIVLLSLALSAVAAPAARQSCADVTVFFARVSTSECLGGKSLSFVGVNYPASIGGFLEGGDPNGARTMANDVNSIASSCPNTEIVMSGYSQGAQVTHLAAVQLSTTNQNRVKAVVVFGDPDDNQGFPVSQRPFYHLLCTGRRYMCWRTIINAAHLSYGAVNAGAAASFVASHV